MMKKAAIIVAVTIMTGVGALYFGALHAPLEPPQHSTYLPEDSILRYSVQRGYQVDASRYAEQEAHRAGCRRLLRLLYLPYQWTDDRKYSNWRVREHDAPHAHASEATVTPESAADAERDRSIEHQKRYLAELSHYSDEPSATQTQRHSTVPGIQANALYRAYESNELAADERYKGKRLAVTGRVYQIGRDISGSPFLVIGDSGMLDGVQCLFADAASGQIALLNKGDKIVVLGNVGGKTLTWVTMTNCAFLPQ
jgi:hypothetical protein